MEQTMNIYIRYNDDFGSLTFIIAPDENFEHTGVYCCVHQLSNCGVHFAKDCLHYGVVQKAFMNVNEVKTYNRGYDDIWVDVTDLLYEPEADNLTERELFKLAKKRQPITIEIQTSRKSGE